MFVNSTARRWTHLRSGGHTLCLGSEHRLGHDTSKDTCECHAAWRWPSACLRRDGWTDAPEDEERRAGVLGLAERLLVDVAKDCECEGAPYDAGCQRWSVLWTYMGCLMNMPAAADVMAVWLYQSLYSAHSGESGRWYGNSCSDLAGDLSSTGAGGLIAAGGVELNRIKPSRARK